MIDKNKIHEVLHSLWDNNGNTEYNRALQDAQTAFDLMQEEPEQNPVILYGLSGSVGKRENQRTCKGCNNIKGCITCVDGSEYAHIEECNITGIKSKEATGKLKELVDNVTEKGLAEARKQLEELTKECMYSKGNYTNADRLTLCKGCEETCIYNQKNAAESLGISQEEYEEIIDKCLFDDEPELLGADDLPSEEPVSEDLDDYAKEILFWEDSHEDWDRYIIRKTAKHFTDWQKQKDKRLFRELLEIANQEDGCLALENLQLRLSELIREK